MGMMKHHHQVQFHPSVFLPILLLIISPRKTHSRSIIEPCSSSDSCLSLLSYALPYDSKLSEIAYRFQLNITDILAANSISPTPAAATINPIFPATSLLKIPISCPCVDGIRRSTSITYTVRPADTVDSIAEGYGRLVSGDQIRSWNGLSAAGKALVSGERIVVPLPCACFNNSFEGTAAVYMSYAVRDGERLGEIAAGFGVSVAELEGVNGLAQPDVSPGDVLAVPIPACSSANLNWYNESLIVPNGSYALTANNCIKCICELGNLNLHCLPSAMIPSCAHLQCKGSDLFVGDAYVTHTAIGCNITACTYRGHRGGKIFTSLVNSVNVQCPDNQSNSAMSPGPSTSDNPVVPSMVFPPFSAPFSAPYPTMGTDGSDFRNKQNSNVSSYGEILMCRVSWYSLLLLEVVVFCSISLLRRNNI